MTRVSLLLAAAALLVSLAGCAPTTDTASTGTADGAVVLAAPDAAELLAQREDVTVIDVRTPGEYAAGHVAGAQLIDVQAPDFTDQVSKLDPEGTYVVYCKSGNRSAQAAATMADMGFTDLYDAGGFDALAAAGVPVEAS